MSSFTPLLLLRTYSGFDPFTKDPSGTPAIWNLVERLKTRNIPAVVLFSEKEVGSQNAKLERITVPTFAPLIVYRMGHAYGFLPSWLSIGLNRIRVLLATLRLRRRHRCGAVFTDRVHLIDAALLSLIGVPVIWRCLGAAPFIAHSLAGGLSARVLSTIDRWAVRAPIRAIVCTRDGAAWWRFLPADRVGKTVFVPLNGVSRDALDKSADTVVPAVPRILFVNRMIKNKHPHVVVEALARLKSAGHDFKAVLAGYGPELEAIRAAVELHGLSECVTLPGRVASRQMPHLLSQSDIAITINRGGQLSNTFLEAVAYGLCPVVFGKDPITEADVDTMNLLPQDMACFIDRQRPVESLTETLAFLLTNRHEIVDRKRRARAFADTWIENWDQRTDREIALMSEVEAGNRSFNSFKLADKTQLHEKAKPAQVS